MRKMGVQFTFIFAHLYELLIQELSVFRLCELNLFKLRTRNKIKFLFVKLSLKRTDLCAYLFSVIFKYRKKDFINYIGKLFFLLSIAFFVWLWSLEDANTTKKMHFFSISIRWMSVAHRPFQMDFFVRKEIM